MPLFATFAADWSPFGTALWVSLVFCTMAAFLVSPIAPLPARIRPRILVMLPGLLAIGCWLTRWVHSRSAARLSSFFEESYFYKFYFAELDAAFVVCVAFGTAFTLDAIRSGDRPCRVVGLSFSPVYAGLLWAAFWYINGGFGLFSE